jgi:hypothetical protein
VNLTAVRASTRGFATLFRCDVETPLASTLNFVPEANVANATLVQLGSTGELCIYASAASDFLLDVLAFVPGDSGVGLITPTRLLDTHVRRDRRR